MHILVTGGAGYIGSILTESLLEEGHKVVVIDNLQSGHVEAIPRRIPCSLGDFSQSDLFLRQVLNYENIELVVHAAASMSPSNSVINPRDYFQNNLIGSINLIDTMLDCKVNNIIFSSSGCVYGNPQTNPVVEGCLKIPTTPYGESKLMFEQILERYRQAYKLNYIIFRYFNVAGASGNLGSDKPQNNGLIPNTLEVAIGKTKYVPVFGSDYSTPDGSCIRDYVHIKDIAQVHIQAIKNIETLSGVYNLGSGIGYSVFDVIETAKKVTGSNILYKVESRRAGDPAVLVADIDKAKEELGWTPRYSDLETIIKDTWEWMQKHPEGYAK